MRLCRWKESDEIVAIKKLKKSEMMGKNKIHHVRAEREVLVKSNNPWIVELKCSFQDADHLYLVMEYLPGGDLMSLLIKKDTFTEDEARFYMAESVLAVESVHNMNYIHRDLKPDNILIDARGHCKWADFGLSKFYVCYGIIRISSLMIQNLPLSRMALGLPIQTGLLNLGEIGTERGCILL